MISHELRCLFVHIPKCAGTSIEVALGHIGDNVGRGAQDHRSIRAMAPFPGLSALNSLDNILEFGKRFVPSSPYDSSNYRNKFTVSPEQFDDYFKFTIVRNPWDRVFSWYRNVIRDEIHLVNYGISSNCTFADFLKISVGKGALRQNSHWLQGFDGKIDLDFIGRFENLPDTFEEIRQRLSLSDLEFPYENMRNTVCYKNFYDNDSFEIVNDAFRQEILMFGYQFDS